MPKHLISGIIGLIAGLIIGFVGANRLNDGSSNAAQTQMPAPANAPFNQQIHSADIKEQTPGGMLADVQTVLDRAKKEPDNAEAQIAAGDMYARIGRFDEAVSFYQIAQKAAPKDFKANVKLANAYFDAGQFEQAAEFYERALEIDPKHVGARTDFGITFVERTNPDYDRAIKEFEKALETDPKHEATLYNLGVAHFKKGDAEKARASLKQLEQANPTSKLIERLKQTIGEQ
jgi:tetratricopeptide (TPR) repeat protein